MRMYRDDSFLQKYEQSLHSFYLFPLVKEEAKATTVLMQMVMSEV